MLMPTLREFRLRARLSINSLARKADVDYKTAKRADDGEPVQELKALALVEAISHELGTPLSVKEVEDLKIY